MRLLSLVILICLWATPASQAQYRQNDELHVATGLTFDAARVSPNRTVTKSLEGGDIVIEWGAPSVRGRRLSAGLISTYKVWRTGANEASTLHFENDVLIEGEPVPAGTYSVFTIGGKKQWTIILNSVAQQWGAFAYDRKFDVLRVKVVPTEVSEHQEEFVFGFENETENSTDVALRWGTIHVAFTVSASPSS